MRRKLVKQGQSALTVTLPYRWLRAQKLTDHDEVEIDEQGQSLIISSVRGSQTKKKTIKLKHFVKNHVRSIIASLYKAGYDEMVLEFERKQPSLQQMNTIVATFTGLEVVTHKNNIVHIKSFLKLDEKETEQLILKMFQTVHHITELITKDWSCVCLDDIEQLVKHNMRKLRDHTLRTIHLTRYGHDFTYDYYDLVTVLEKLSAAFLAMAQFIVTQKYKKKTDFLQLQQTYTALYQSYLKKDFSQTHMLWKSMTTKEIISRDPFKMYTYHISKLLRHLSSRMLSIQS